MINFGIIGAGRMGSNHANCIAELPNAKVTAVYDIRPEASAAMNEKHGAVICNSPEELAARADVDCVVITSPTYCHQEGIAAAMAAAFTAIDLKKYSVLSMICYIGMGWCIVIALKPTLECVPLAGLLWLLAGGISYTVGAVLYGLGKKHRYMHSIFHLFVVLGSILQFVCIVFYVI